MTEDFPNKCEFDTVKALKILHKNKKVNNSFVSIKTAYHTDQND